MLQCDEWRAVSLRRLMSLRAQREPDPSQRRAGQEEETSADQEGTRSVSGVRAGG